MGGKSDLVTPCKHNRRGFEALVFMRAEILMALNAKQSILQIPTLGLTKGNSCAKFMGL
jgi:hypothetical protein